MKQLIIALVATVIPALGLAAGGEHNPYIVKAPINLQGKVSQQKGAQIFVNNCLGCHSAKYMRYERVAQDLEIPNDIMLAPGIWNDVLAAMLDVRRAHGWSK